MKKNTKEDIFRNIQISSEEDCWIYKGKQKPNKTGHLEVWLNGKKRGVYVHSYEHYIGPVPKGICVLHKCDNPPCCNPKHLFLGTRADNARDREAKGRNYMANRKYCIRGHEYAICGFYVRVYKENMQMRVCKECAKDNRRRYYERKKESY